MSSTTLNLMRQTLLLVCVFCCALQSGPLRAATCSASVTTGFAGDVNATYSGDYGGGGDGGGGGGGDSGGGGAGAGAGEGKVLGGLMTMTRISDGATLGSAVTDSVNGLVTLKPCVGDLPVLLTLTGQPGAKYYDEGTNQVVDFGTGNVLHALIDSLNENVGVSPLTEAAYRYAINNYVLNPADVRAHRVPLTATGNVVGLTLAQVVAANSVVLSEFNRTQTTSMQLVTLKSLPTPIDSASPSTALPNNRYGIAAAVLGGLAKMGNNYVPSTSSPALSITEQLAQDLTDGKLDGFRLDALPATGLVASVAYDPVRFPIAASVGANAVSAQFGTSTVLARATDIAETSQMAVLFDGETTICSGAESATLLKDGSLRVARTDCGGTSTTLANFATQVSLVEASGIGEVPRSFFTRKDGSVWAWGEAMCGLLGTGETAPNFRSTPVQISGLKNVTSIANGSYFTLARDSSGSVYAWGLNYIGELGMGIPPPGAVACNNQFYPPTNTFYTDSAVTTPQRVPALSNIVTVAADRVTGYALDHTGNLFQWGLIPTGYNFSAPQPYFGEYGTQPFPVKVAGLPQTVAIAVSYYMKMALAADGTLWGFGPNTIGNFGDGSVSPRLAPTQVPGISSVVEIGASGDSPFVALLQDGSIRYWGGCCIDTNQNIPAFIKKVPTAPAAGSTPFYSATGGNFIGTLPRIRHVKGSGGAVLLYGVDGSLYQFPKSQVEHVFVVLFAAPPAVSPNYTGLFWNSPAGSESGWGINFAHQGDVIFATWFTYDLTGRAWWLSMTANKMGEGTYAGTFYQTKGPALSAVPFSPAAVSSIAVGTATLTFSDTSNGTFAYSVNGTTQTKAITRQVFGAVPTCVWGAQPDLTLATNFQDLWWAAPAGVESGWGINFTQQGSTIFATWFTYGADGAPLWLTVTALNTAPGVFSGTLYATSGPPFNAVPFLPSRIASVPVGTATFSFANGNTGTFGYSVAMAGIAATQTKPITRQVFRAPGTVCQ
jgi:hypothetical protein